MKTLADRCLKKKIPKPGDKNYDRKESYLRELPEGSNPTASFSKVAVSSLREFPFIPQHSSALVPGVTPDLWPHFQIGL